MIELRDVSVRYGRKTAVSEVNLDLPAGKIYGLLGRNGSGKTSLLSALASYRRPSTGRVLVNGAEAYENPEVMRSTCFIRDSLDVTETDRLQGVCKVAGWLRPTFDSEYAAKLLDLFQLDPRERVMRLSRGQKSALGVVLGLAARAPLTILDESYLGMDAVARSTFYREVLADYLAHPRTFILSTHLIEEVADLFERVVILDRGRVLLHEETEQLRGRGVTVTGPAAAVGEFVTGRTVLSERSLGGIREATLDGRPDPADVARAEAAGLTFGPVGVQELFVHLTSSQPLEATR
ncbi:ATP-binding cassette domain-containing protein [Paractinoplanes rishiriensis]|uniref:ABC transporter n=1 Tax=Paractinoplanes rishiriensis TaxID=1050105 RepID=A0A919JUQ6_9ACTN|nr:ABC transporter ATP-binding protein [Actinoplanes rishiriensis]GIE93702.1 ABC transporter [Actinoplanes rishiriensis]